MKLDELTVEANAFIYRIETILDYLQSESSEIYLQLAGYFVKRANDSHRNPTETAVLESLRKHFTKGPVDMDNITVMLSPITFKGAEPFGLFESLVRFLGGVHTMEYDQIKVLQKLLDKLMQDYGGTPDSRAILIFFGSALNFVESRL